MKSPNITVNLVPQSITPYKYIGITKFNNKYKKELSSIIHDYNINKSINSFIIKYKLIDVSPSSYNDCIYEITIYEINLP